VSGPEVVYEIKESGKANIDVIKKNPGLDKKAIELAQKDAAKEAEGTLKKLLVSGGGQPAFRFLQDSSSLALSFLYR
jgi:hypothetical protein